MQPARKYRKLPEHSAITYVLKGLIPYTDANLKLAFSPKLFFDELEGLELQQRTNRGQGKVAAHKRQSLRNAFYKAKKRGLVELDEGGTPRLTPEGRRRLKPYQATKLKGSVRLMVIFDIPEKERRKRQHIRLLLRELHFTKEQRSVWITEYDCKDYLRAEIQYLGLQECVRLYECSRISW